MKGKKAFFFKGMNFYRIDWWCEICAQRLIEIQLKRIFTHNKLQIRERIYLGRISRIDCVDTHPESFVHIYFIYLNLHLYVRMEEIQEIPFWSRTPQSSMPFAWRLNVTHHKLCTKRQIDFGQRGQTTSCLLGLKWKRQKKAQASVYSGN